MYVDWWTVLLEGINFVILVAVLWRFLYKPVREVIERRRGHIQDELDAAARARGEADELRAVAADQLGGVDAERERLLHEARENIDSERRRVLDEARDDADALARAVRRELAEEREEAADEVRSAAAELAVALATRLLEEVRDQDLLELFLKRAVDALASMLAAGDASAARALQAGQQVVVRTEPALSSEAVERWTERLRQVLGTDVGLEFETTDELVAGVELVLPDAILRYAWGDALAQARQELARDVGAA